MTDNFDERLRADAAAHDIAQWPALNPAALHGEAGRFVQAAAPFSEGDPVGILISTMVLLGCAINRGPHILAATRSTRPGYSPASSGKPPKREKEPPDRWPGL